MGKKIILIFVLLISCIFILLYIFKVLLPEKELKLDQANKTFVVKGDVRIKKTGEGAGWHNMEASTVLEKGDTVETGKNSSVDIVIGNDTEKTIRLGEKSHVEFQGINPADLSVSQGKLLVALKKLEPKSSFVIKTPTAICGARGTGWIEEVLPEKTKVSVFESEIFAHEVGANGKRDPVENMVAAGTQRTLEKNKPISEIQTIRESDLEEWSYWYKFVISLRDGRILVDDFDRKENFNNLGGSFGSWNMFYSDPTQFCKDELTDLDRVGNEGYCLKLTYDVDSSFSAYNGFFTNLMGIDISSYKYLVFYIKGDAAAGFTTRINLELKNKAQIGKMSFDGITDGWQKVVLPIGDFAGINDLSDMKELVIVFSDINVSKKEGVIYIDDIYFSKA